MRQKFKQIFQPLEIAVKKALGIKKVKKGKLFDENGFLQDGCEKLTRYALFVPFYQKVKIITNVNELSDKIARGGGVTLYTLKTRYKVFGIQIFGKTTTIYHTQKAKFSLWANLTLGKYLAETPNIEQKILNLIKNLSKENQAFVLRQLGRCKKCYETNNALFTDLSQYEFDEWQKISTEFLPNIFKLSENLYSYKHYLLPINHFEISVFWDKHSFNVLEPQTLAKIKQKDIIDAGGYVGDSTLIFEEFTDKNIYTFEPTRDNYNRILQTIALNNLKRVIPVNKGLGAEKSKMEIGISEYNYGLGSSIAFSEHFQNTETIEITTLDDFVRENKIQVGFIKVDIEGFEMEFLKGAKETICTQKPAMLISIYHQPSDYFDIKPLIESWNLGYKFKIHKGVEWSITTETALFCEILE